MKQKPLDLEALLRVPFVQPGYRQAISPDGKQIAFSYNQTGWWEIHTIPLDGSTRPQVVTTGKGAKFAPRWSPDGSRLAYVMDIDGGEFYDIYLWERSTDTHTNLTPDTPDLIMPNFDWSPDGSHLAYVSNQTGQFDTYLLSISERESKPLLSLLSPDWEVLWSPDGSRLAVTSETGAQDVDTFIVSKDGKDVQQLIGPDGPLHAKDPCWSPDGSRIAFSAHLDDYFNIGVYHLATNEVVWLTAGEGEKVHPTWSADGNTLAFLVNHGPYNEISMIDMESKSMSTLQVERGIHYWPQFTPDGEGLVTIFENPCHPCDLWYLSLSEGTSRPITQSLPSALQEEPFVLPSEISYPSDEGVSVPALLFQPATMEGNRPAVVYVHGGPTSITPFEWDPQIQYMVSRGWVVLAPNYRGSSGYGREWQVANRFDLGGGDTRDIVAGADYLAREDLTDPDRIAITGVSFGGYLTMTSLTQYPDHWAAGSAIVPFLNWFTVIENERPDLQHWDRENFGDPDKDRDLFYERSPYFFLDRINSPVQIVCGAHDLRCPVSESIEAKEALEAKGKTCDFVLYPDEGHYFLNIENSVEYKKRRAAFLAQHLEKES
jgi:dipeptidyl aminopeptidase/acylaminoacyl peptidase